MNGESDTLYFCNRLDAVLGFVKALVTWAIYLNSCPLCETNDVFPSLMDSNKPKPISSKNPSTSSPLSKVVKKGPFGEKKLIK